MQILFEPVAFIRNKRTQPTDDYWEEIITEIELAPHIPDEALLGLSDFSHLEIIYHFHQLDKSETVFAGRPRGNLEYPLVGIFGQRKKDRPNAIGLTTVQLLKQTARTITVKYLDAIDGTPVLDIKPVLKEFEPKGDIRQPQWATALMKNYWK